MVMWVTIYWSSILYMKEERYQHGYDEFFVHSDVYGQVINRLAATEQ